MPKWLQGKKRTSMGVATQIQKNGVKCEVISYCAGIAVLRFKNYHSGVTCEAYFPIGNVRSDGQGQVEWSSEPRTV